MVSIAVLSELTYFFSLFLSLSQATTWGASAPPKKKPTFNDGFSINTESGHLRLLGARSLPHHHDKSARPFAAQQQGTTGAHAVDPPHSPIIHRNSGTSLKRVGRLSTFNEVPFLINPFSYQAPVISGPARPLDEGRSVESSIATSPAVTCLFTPTKIASTSVDAPHHDKSARPFAAQQQGTTGAHAVDPPHSPIIHRNSGTCRFGAGKQCAFCEVHHLTPFCCSSPEQGLSEAQDEGRSVESSAASAPVVGFFITLNNTSASTSVDAPLHYLATLLSVPFFAFDSVADVTESLTSLSLASP